MIKQKVERIPTGIQDLDAIIGGLVAGRTHLLSGEPGTGKSMFSYHFMYNALKHGHTVGLITTEEPTESIMLHSALLGMPLEKYVNKSLKIVDIASHRAMEAAFATPTGDYLIQSFRDMQQLIPPGIDCLVIDTITPYILPMNPTMARETAIELVMNMESAGLTSLLILDESVSEHVLMTLAAPMYGHIQLVYQKDPYTGKTKRCMYIRKLRATTTPINPLIYNLTDKGISIQKEIKD